MYFPLHKHLLLLLDNNQVSNEASASPSLQSKFPILTLLLQKSPMLDNPSTAANDDSLGNGNPSFDQLPQYKQWMAQNESELGKIFIQGF